MIHKELFFVSIFCLLIALLMTNQLIAQEVSLKPYGIESGIIEYKYSGSEVGKGIMYFDEFGSRCAMNMDTKRGEEVNKGWVISHKEYQYIFDPAKPNDGLKMKNPIIESLMKMDKQDYDKVAEDLYSQMGMNKAGTEKFLDKDCIAYKGIFYTIEWYYDESAESQALDYLLKLNAEIQKRVFYLFKRICDNGKINDITKFRNEGDKIYAFKPQPDRFLSFFVKDRTIIVTNAFRKKTDKLPKNEKAKALKFRLSYIQRVKKGKYYEED